MNYYKIILNLIVFFCLSNNVSAQSYSQALLDSANAGYANAQNKLGYMYEKGEGVTKDYAEALKWFRMAAEQGEDYAQYNLGYMYQKGRGVTQDYAEALKWFRKAAEQGNAYAQNDLGYMYQNGKGVTQDYAEALKWYRKAAEQGNADAKKNISILNDLGVPIENFSWQKLFGGKNSATFKYYGMGIRTTSVEQAMREMGLDWEDLIYDVTLTINANKTGKITYRIIPNEKANNNQRIHYRNNGMRQRHYDFVSAFCDAVSHKGIIGESGQVQLHGDHFTLCEYEFYPCDNYNSISVKGLMKMFKLKRVGK